MSSLGRRLTAIGLAVLAAPGTFAQEPGRAEAPFETPAVTVTVAEPFPTPAPACDACACAPFDWKKVPRVRSFPRPGHFGVPTAGPGYYSFLDQLTGQCQPNPPKHPYPRFGLIQPSFFDTDNFSYLDDPKNTETDFFDPLKRIRLGDNWLFVTGGDIRTRYENLHNARLTETSIDATLTRLRVYGDLWYRDDFRVFGEFIGAWADVSRLAPLPIDANDADFLNLFVDMKVATIDGEPAYLRVGRQELLLGSQRLVSPLDWANTRRTFQGVRAFRQSECWDVDLFWVQPVVPNVDRLDSVDNNVNFAGAWSTYRPKKGQAIDAYYLLLDTVGGVVQQGIVRGQTTRHTLGSRYSGNVDNVLFDFEGAMQFGSQSGRDVVAGMATAGAGYNFKDVRLNPTFWAYYDYASGGGETSGTAHTFHQLFPFGHYYLGWIDQVGRQNIHDLNFHMYLYPTHWITTWVQFHNFWLADSSDALYNAAGNAIRRDPTGRSGSFVGQELDLVLNFHMSKHLDILTGYSYLWGGDFLRNTASPTRAEDASLLFVQMSYRW